MASDKHRNIADEIVGNGPVAVARRDFEKFSSAIAAALSNAEREGMKRATTVMVEEAAKWPLGARVNMKAVAADIERAILSEAKEGE